MNSKSKISCFLYFLICILVSAPPAVAVDYRVAIGHPTVQLNVNLNDTFEIVTYDERSYCCSIDGGQQTTSIAWGSVFNLTTSGTNSSVTRTTEGAVLDTGTRLCHYQDDVSGQLKLQYAAFTAAGTQFATVSCEETTLVGGFNTSVTDFNFLEISGQALSTSSVVSGKVFITTVVSAQTIEIPFTIDFSSNLQQRLDLNIHEAIGGAKDFGQVTIIHNAAEGMLKARLSQYRLVSLLPFDFEPVLQEVFVKRAPSW